MSKVSDLSDTGRHEVRLSTLHAMLNQALQGALGRLGIAEYRLFQVGYGLQLC